MQFIQNFRVSREYFWLHLWYFHVHLGFRLRAFQFVLYFSWSQIVSNPLVSTNHWWFILPLSWFSVIFLFFWKMAVSTTVCGGDSPAPFCHLHHLFLGSRTVSLWSWNGTVFASRESVLSATGTVWDFGTSTMSVEKSYHLLVILLLNYFWNPHTCIIFLSCTFPLVVLYKCNYSNCPCFWTRQPLRLIKVMNVW